MIKHVMTRKEAEHFVWRSMQTPRAQYMTEDGMTPENYDLRMKEAHDLGVDESNARDHTPDPDTLAALFAYPDTLR